MNIKWKDIHRGLDDRSYTSVDDCLRSITPLIKTQALGMRAIMSTQIFQNLGRAIYDQCAIPRLGRNSQ